ncbi:MAG: CAP domain-containing protein [Acidimicrobiia bacterium]
MPVRAVAERALAAAIVVQLSVAGIVAATGGPQAEATSGVERAEISAAAQIADRDLVSAAQAGDPVELAAEPLPAPPPPPAPSPAPAPAPAELEPPAPPPTTVPPPPPTTTAPPPPPPTTEPPAQAPAPSTQSSTAGSWRDAPCEAAMLGWMNEARAGAGTAALGDDAAVDHVAFRWSDHLAGTGDLRHNPGYADQVFQARPEAMTAGEVVGVGAEPRPIFDEFLRSPTHRDAIMRRAFTHATVGCVRDASGRVWVTANFWG